MAHVDLSSLPSLYADHVRELVRLYALTLARHQLDAVVLSTGTPQKKSTYDDQFWPLVGIPHTRHWLPLAVADCALVIAGGMRPRLLLNTARDFWEGPAEPESSHFWSAFDVVECQGVDAIKAQLPRGRRAFVGDVTYAEGALRAAGWGFGEAELAPAALVKDLDALRVHKTAYELVCLREANRRACLGHDAVLRAFAEGEHSELDLHLLYLQATRQDDPETPYKNIVALGEHAATLHHVSYGRQQVSAQSLLLDAGATFSGYDSDITRTAVKGRGAVADCFRGLVDGVDKLQRELCRRALPGKRYEDLHNESHQLLAEVLRDAKISSASCAELVDTGATRKLLPHGLGHSLGIQTHDVGCRNVQPEGRNPFLRNTSTISAGQVFTIEPGCYFVRSLLEELRALPVASSFDWGLVDELVAFGGVRIEDDVRVTEAGVENMTRTFLAG
jgi:Xaa-Pro dipeptidase